MLNWLNPWRWWEIFQLHRRWKVTNRQFIDAYHQQDFLAAEMAGKLMGEIAVKLGKRQFRLENYYNLMLCYSGMEQLELAIDCGKRVVDLQRSLSTNPDHPKLADRICEVAHLYQQQGQIDDAAQWYGQALTIRKRLDSGNGSRALIELLENLAAIAVTKSDEKRAQQLIDEAQLYRQKLGLIADAKSSELTKAIDKIKSRHRDEHLTDLEQWKKLTKEGWKLNEQEEVRSAIPITERALTIARKIFPAPNKDLATSLNNLALLYREQGRWADAEPLLDEALMIRRKLFGDTANNQLANSLNNLAALYASQGRWADAEPLFDEALKIFRELFGKTANNDLADSLTNLAVLYESQGRWADAEPLFDEALKICRKLFGKTANNQLANSLNNSKPNPWILTVKRSPSICPH
jgi:tetratricopeptide (TPR) repeat protein